MVLICLYIIKQLFVLWIKSTFTEKSKSFGRKTNSREYVGFVPIAVLERKNTGCFNRIVKAFYFARKENESAYERTKTITCVSEHVSGAADVAGQRAAGAGERSWRRCAEAEGSRIDFG